jgi:hypothetical protein
LKYKRYVYIAFAVVIILAAIPVCTCTAAGVVVNVISPSDVQCVVEPIYDFALPSKGSLQYPDSKLAVGQFRIEELLLASGESLSVILKPSALKKDDGGSVPYTVMFNPPDTFDERQSGEAYDIWLEIDAEAFNSAAAGTYTASLLFSVVSYPSNKVVWQGTTTITTVKQDTENILGEKVPATGIFANGYFWSAASVSILIASFIAYRGIRKKFKNIHSGADDTDEKECKETRS